MSIGIGATGLVEVQPGMPGTPVEVALSDKECPNCESFYFNVDAAEALARDLLEAVAWCRKRGVE